MDFIIESNRIYLNDADNKLIAEITFPNISPDTVNINHTFVDESLRGKGVAGQLMLAAYNKLKSDNKKVVATCSYAIAWLERHKEYSDILNK